MAKSNEERIDDLEVRMRDVERVVANVKFVGVIAGLMLTLVLGAIGYLLIALGELKEAKANAAATATRFEANAKEMEARLAKAIDKSEANLRDLIKRTQVGMIVHEGKVVQVKGNRLTIHEGGRDATYTIAKDAVIEINGKKGTLEQIRIGAIASVFVVHDAEVSRIEVTQPK